MADGEGHSVGSLLLNSHVKSLDAHLSDSSWKQVFSLEVATFCLHGDGLLHVQVLVDNQLKLARILNLVRSEEGINLKTTVGVDSKSVKLVAALEVQRSLSLVPLLVVGPVDRDSVVVAIRREEALSIDGVVLEFKVLRVSQLDEAT